MSNFVQQPPSNDGQGVTETNPLAEIFSERYSFGAPIYNIENNPGSAPPVNEMVPEDPIEFPPPLQEPTPAALTTAGNGADEAWFQWNGVSPLQVSVPSGDDVRSIYIVGNFDGFNIYVTSGFTVGGIMTVSPGYSKDMVPIPPGSSILTLYITQAQFVLSNVYVCAYAKVWNPFDNGGAGGGGVGNGFIIWLQPQPPAIGSGQVYRNTSKNIQLITVGGTGAQAYINGNLTSGGQPATYEVDQNSTLELVYGLDVSIITMSNIVHYYAMEKLDTTTTTPDSLTPVIEGQFFSLQTSPAHYALPSLYTPLTSDKSPSIQMNAPVTGYNDDYGWGFGAGGSLTGDQSWVFWYEDLGQYTKSQNNGTVFLFLIRSTHANPAPCIQALYTPAGTQTPSPLITFSIIDHAGVSGVNQPLPDPGTGPHMITITWKDSTGTMTVGFDNNTPTSATFTGWVSGQAMFAPSFGADNNGLFVAHIALAKMSQWNTVLSSTVVSEIYEQSTNAVNPVYQFYEVL